MPVVSGSTHICTRCTSAVALAFISEWRDARAGAHPLREARIDHAHGAGAVAVLELAVEHPRDDLHVGVRVRAEASAAADDVVVVHEQQPVMGVGRVVVAPKLKLCHESSQSICVWNRSVSAANVHGHGRSVEPRSGTASALRCGGGFRPTWRRAARDGVVESGQVRLRQRCHLWSHSVLVTLRGR